MSRGYFGSLGHALVTVAVVEGFKSGRCRDRGGSRERVQGVHTSPPTEMTCGFLIQLVFCQKNYVVYWC